MKPKTTVLLAGMLAMPFLTMGCADSAGSTVGAVTKPVANAGKTVAGFVSKPFKAVSNSLSNGGSTEYVGASKDISARTSSDAYGAAVRGSNRRAVGEYRTNPQKALKHQVERENAMNEVLGSDANSPMSADVSHLGSVLEDEMRRLEAREKLEWERLQTYEEKQKEIGSLRDEYELRRRATQRRLENLRKIMDLMKKDPEALARLGTTEQLIESGIDSRSSAFDSQVFGEEYSSCAAPGNGWQESRGVESPTKTSATPAPAVDDASALPWEDNEPSYSSTANVADPAPAFGQKSPKQVGKEKDDTLSASILAMDGEGLDATMILGAGTREGVERGMIFAVGEGRETTVLVVTKAYPTYARAVPHPKFNSRPIHVRDHVRQILTLPDVAE